MIAEVLQQIRNYPDHDVLIGLTDIGKEWVLERIATEFKEKVYSEKVIGK